MGSDSTTGDVRSREPDPRQTSSTSFDLFSAHSRGAGQFEAEIIARITETDIANHRAEERIVVGKFAGFDVAADQIAQHAPEIFMPRKRHERARISEHADETRKQTDIGDGVQLPFDRFFLVEVPPAAAELHFPGD